MKYLVRLGMILCVICASCTKQLNLSPYNQLETGAFFKSTTGFQAAVIGLYSGLVGAQLSTNDDYYGGSDYFSLVASNDVLSDNLIVSQNGRFSQIQFQTWTYTGSNSTDFFKYGYEVIRRANEILTYLPYLKDTIRNDYAGEALAVRAMVHFDLARVYAKTYTNATSSDLGVPYVTSVDSSLTPGRDLVTANYDSVRNDLMAASTLINDDNGVGRLNKASVYGLLSRLYLYRGEYQNCIDAATMSLSANSDPASLKTFPLIWLDQTENGVLFKITITDKDNVSVGTAYSQTGKTGVKSEYVCSYDLYTQYDSSDVRKSAYISTSDYANVTYNNIQKYSGRASGNANVVDVKVIRVAEVLLNRAEAESRLGGLDVKALTDLDALRKNRYTTRPVGKSGESGAALLNAILLERRLELAFEGDRFFDIKRQNIDLVRDAVHGDVADGSGTPYTMTTLKAGDFRFQLPIPQADINANSKLIQNPGY